MEDEFEGTENGEEQEESIETTPEGQDYKNVADMSEEDILEFQQDDPKGYAANLSRQIRAEIGKERDVNAFANSNPVFDGVYRSGTLHKILDENPQLHGNLISAFLIHQNHDARMKDPKKHGGVDKVLADRLSERRGVRKSKQFGAFQDTSPTMPEDM